MQIFSNALDIIHNDAAWLASGNETNRFNIAIFSSSNDSDRLRCSCMLETVSHFIRIRVHYGFGVIDNKKINLYELKIL